MRGSGARSYNPGMSKISEFARDADALDPDASLVEAAALMADAGTGFVPVIEKGRAAGVVTAFDLVRAAAAGLAPEETTVEEIMTSELAWCRAGDDAAATAARMRRSGRRRLLVLGTSGELTGVVALEALPAGPAPDLPARAARRGA